MVQHNVSTGTSTAGTVSRATHPLPGYFPLPGVYDEAFAAPRSVRPHWDSVVQALDDLGGQELARRWDQARHMMYEHGVTYNIHGKAQGLDRPWQLDPIPLVLAPQEWVRLEAALIQRARLLNALLADVYGPQHLLRQGLLPPEFVYAHGGFLRPCHGIRVPQGCYLHLHAVDLVRTPAGQWWVAADGTQSPAGAGYAVENRLILSRTLSDMFRGIHVQPLKPFFDTVHQTLCDLAVPQRHTPRIVLLTPGPDSQTYFEHVYLARLLGYTLVQGTDLTVRDTRVFLKTLAGLQPVDVILRRQDDIACDPLGLEQDSAQGTAGLVQVVRAGSVVVANALGSGWLETPALLPFLPALSRHLLGEELQLAAVPTWWCGLPEGLAYALEHRDHLDISLAFPHPARAGARQFRFNNRASSRLLARMRAQPYAFVAQGPLERSTVPVWRNQGVHPGYMMLRVYLAATPDGYTVMPGGLGRISSTAKTSMESAQWGNGSKDTWVLSSTPPHSPGLLTALSQPVPLRRSGYDLPSRVADNLLWLGRYAERAEGAIRLLRSILQRCTDEAGPGSNTALPALLRAMSGRWRLPPAPVLESWQTSMAAFQQTVLQVIYDVQFQGSVRDTLSALHQVATRVRERISMDAWRILVQLDQHSRQEVSRSLVPASAVLGWLNQALVVLVAFSGLGMENMTRGPGWLFLDMGRRLERAVSMVGLLQSALVRVESYEEVVLEAMLEIADSSITYRSRYLTTLQFAPVLDLLLSDTTNPRSVIFQLVALADHVEHLPRDVTDPSLNPTRRLALTLLTALQLAEVTALCAIDGTGQRPHLAELLTQLTQGLPALAETITHQYLSHAEPSRHLATAGRVSEP